MYKSNVYVIDVCELNIDTCGYVYLCLDSPWEDRTLSGLPFVRARVTSISKNCTTEQISRCCNITTRDITDCRYDLEVDNSISFKVNPATSMPYVLTSEEIGELIPYDCFVGKLIEYLVNDPDHVLDYENVESTTDAVTNQVTLTLPVIDRISGNPIGEGNLVINGGVLGGDLPTSDITYTSSAGKVFTLNVGDLLESQIDGVTIVRNPITGIYSSVTSAPPIPDITVPTVTDTCDTLGIGGYYVTNVTASGHELTLTRHPERIEIVEGFRFAGQNYLDPVAVATLQTGDSNIQTPAFVTFFLANPSTCRDLRVLIEATGSFAAASTPATGFVVFGHTLWINGAKVADRNGRSNAGFNVSWADGTGILQDYGLTDIKYPHTIPKGGSVTVGLDFGDSDTFPTIGTTTTLSLESRQIVISGGFL